MKLSNLLATRESLIRQANLANMAYSFFTLKRLADRIHRAALVGLVTLRQADESEELYWATLTAAELSQSVIEEHFDDDDVSGMADAISFSTGTEFSEISFKLEDMADLFVDPLVSALKKEGVSIDLSGAIRAASDQTKSQRINGSR